MRIRLVSSRLVFFSLWIGVGVAFLSACSNSLPNVFRFDERTDAAANASSEIKVIDVEGRSVADAKFVVDAQSITIDAPGFARATYLGINPQAGIFQMRRLQLASAPILQGKTTGFGTLVKDGRLDVSMVYPAVPTSRLSSLDFMDLVGSGTDKVTVYGKELELPTGVSVPAQTENYFMVVPISIDKPIYRTSVPENGTYRFAAIHAQFDFVKTIDDFRAGKTFFDLINRLDFKSYSTRDFGIQLPLQAADIPVNENPLTPVQTVQAIGLPKNYALLATRLAEQNGLGVVTDLKWLLEGESRSLKGLASPGTSRSWLVRSLKKYDATRTDLSGADFDEATTIAAPADSAFASSRDFLPILSPILAQGRKLIFKTPTLPPGLVAGMTQVTLSKVTPVRTGNMWTAKKEVIWTFFANGFVSELAIPYFGTEPWSTSGRYRWEVSFGASATGGSLLLSTTALGELSHVTKSAIDFVIP